MAKQTSDATEPEQDRLELVQEMNVEQGADWEEQNKPGTFGCHELLDRTHLLAEMVEGQILMHPACVRNREWYALADKAASALQELYQGVGAKHLGETTPEAS